MNPLSTYVAAAELEYRQERIAEDMEAAACWSHLIRRGAERMIAAALRRRSDRSASEGFRARAQGRARVVPLHEPRNSGAHVR